MSSTLSRALCALAMTAALGGPAAAQTAISTGQTVTGSLAASDGRFADGRVFDCYRLRPAKGQDVQLLLRSADFDALLLIWPGRECKSPDDENTNFNDDGAGGRNARYGLFGNGQDTAVAVTAVSAGGAGAYSFAVLPEGARLTGEALVAEQLSWYADHLTDMNLTITQVGETRMTLDVAGSREWTITLPSDANYAVMGMCDENCRDFDLVVKNPAGEVIAAEQGPSDVPAVWVRGPGSIHITGYMSSCGGGGCLAGVRVYQTR